MQSIIKKTICTLLILAPVLSTQADQNKSELTDLFKALKSANNLIEMSEIQNEIWFHWYELPTRDQALQSIFDQGMQALHFGQPQIAVIHFTRVTESAPDFAEGWNRRATAFFMLGDFDASLADIQQTLILEPRHFGALGGLSMIFENTQQYDRAIQAEQLLLDLMPQNTMISERIESLKSQELKSGI